MSDSAHNASTAAEWRSARLSVALNEYERARDEIDHRMEMASHVIVAYITAVGAAISIAPKASDVLLAVAFVAGPAWLLWLDHTEQICKLAGYVGVPLNSRIHLLVDDDDALGWERFLRSVDRGGSTAGRELFPSLDPPPTVDAHHTRRAAWYTLLLFLLTPLLLLVAWVVLLHVNDQSFSWLRGMGMAAALLVTAFASHEFLRFRAFAAAIDAAIDRTALTRRAWCPRRRISLMRSEVALRPPNIDESS